MNNRIYKITYDQAAFLNKNILNKTILKKIENILFKKKYIINTIEISLSENEVAELLDELSYQFTDKGLLENDEPNEFGMKIEDLIDIFSNYSN